MVFLQPLFDSLSAQIPGLSTHKNKHTRKYNKQAKHCWETACGEDKATGRKTQAAGIRRDFLHFHSLIHNFIHKLKVLAKQFPVRQSMHEKKIILNFAKLSTINFHIINFTKLEHKEIKAVQLTNDSISEQTICTHWLCEAKWTSSSCSSVLFSIRCFLTKP